MEMNGRVAIVTGGARGIGYAIAERLSRAGAQVAIADVSEEGAEEAAERLRSAEGKAIGVRVDVRRVPSRAHGRLRRGAGAGDVAGDEGCGHRSERG